MKKNIKSQITDSELKSRPEQRSTNQRPDIDFEKRKANRSLPVEELVELLRNEAPAFYDLAEIVEKWVWITFTEKQPCTITCQLAEFGFHWNKVRQSWQHPCGSLPERNTNFDPRQKYGSRHAANQKAA